MNRIPKEITVDGQLYRMVEDHQLNEIAMIGFDALKKALPKHIGIFNLIRCEDSYSDGQYTFWYEYDRNQTVKFAYDYNEGTLGYIYGIHGNGNMRHPEHVRSLHDLVDEVEDALEDVAEELGYDESLSMTESSAWHKFTKNDWRSYAGAERLSSGSQPLMSTPSDQLDIILSGTEDGNFEIEMNFYPDSNEDDEVYVYAVDLGRGDEEEAIEEFERFIKHAKNVRTPKEAQRVAHLFDMELIYH